MKKICPIIIFIVFMFASCFAEKFNSICEIELLMSEKELLDVIKNSNLKPVELPFGTTVDSKLEGEDIKAYHIDRYVCENNIIIEDITVSFIFDRLYCIHITTYNPELEKWLKGKYKIVEREYDAENYIEKLRWETNSEDITCRSLRHTNELVSNPTYHFLLISDIPMVYVRNL